MRPDALPLNMGNKGSKVGGWPQATRYLRPAQLFNYSPILPDLKFWKKPSFCIFLNQKGLAVRIQRCLQHLDLLPIFSAFFYLCISAEQHILDHVNSLSVSTDFHFTGQGIPRTPERLCPIMSLAVGTKKSTLLLQALHDDTTQTHLFQPLTFAFYLLDYLLCTRKEREKTFLHITSHLIFTIFQGVFFVQFLHKETEFWRAQPTCHMNKPTWPLCHHGLSSETMLSHSQSYIHECPL